MPDHHPYNQTEAQKKHLKSANPTGFCESAVSYWHYCAFRLTDFEGAQVGLMKNFDSQKVTKLLRDLQDRQVAAFKYDPNKYEAGSARLDAMVKLWKLQDTAKQLNTRAKSYLDYDPPGKADAGDYQSMNKAVWDTINVKGNLCYLMLRSSSGGHGIGTYRSSKNNLLYLFDPNQGVFVCKELFSFSDYTKNIINYTTKNTSIGSITKIAAIRAKNIVK